MDALKERRTQDLQKIRDLSSISTGRVNIVSTSGNPLSRIVLDLRVKTASSVKYPSVVQDTTRVEIELPQRYPFAEPTASIITPIFHPNVYASGRICLGLKWLPSQGLDLLVMRIVEIIRYDEAVLNLQSPANRDAARWYPSAKAASPRAFPTDSTIGVTGAAASKIKWSNASIETPPQAARVVACPRCSRSLRIPGGRKGMVKCPSCAQAFEVSA